MTTTFNLIINDELADQIIADPETYKELASHCEGLDNILNLQEFKITDSSGRTIYTSENP